MKLTLDTTRQYQTFGGIGASGAWWAQYAGTWTKPDKTTGEETRARLAKLLYSPTEGIGMQIYRYNLGGGSASSGRGSYVDRWRRAEDFYAPDGSLDFTKDAGAVAMLRLVVAAGASEVVFFVNSPPERLTKNGMAQLGRRQLLRTNLAKKQIPAFADYCLDVTAHFLREGIPVRYLSPVNEPLWLWNGGQEGCHYSPRQVLRVLSAFADAMKKRTDLPGLKLAAAENGDIRWLNRAYTRVCLKKEAVRGLLDGIDVHAYCIPQAFLPRFLNDRAAFLRRFRAYLDRRFPGVPVQTSEWTHMKGGRDAGMDSALETARVMLEDFTLLHVTKFSHWLACSHYDYCDGLIYLDPETQTYTLTKRYFVTGQFSKYIPLGAMRFETEADEPDVKSVGFVKDGIRTAVLMNAGTSGKTFSAPFKGRFILTDETHSLDETAFTVGQSLTLPGRSVATLQEDPVC